MSLPKVSLPTYECTLPTTGKTVQFRPFVSKEEKVLLMAMESKDEKQILTAMKNIVHSCSNGTVNTAEITSVDLEWFFLNLRAKSVGETSTFNIFCDNEVDGQKCNQKIEYSINVLDASVGNTDNIKKDVDIDGNIVIRLKVPTIDKMSELQKVQNATGADILFEIIRASIDFVYEKNKSDSEVTKFSDVPTDEQREWIDSLPATVLEQFAEYVQNLPKLEHKTTFSCPKCGKQHVQEFSGVGDFFS